MGSTLADLIGCFCEPRLIVWPIPPTALFVSCRPRSRQDKARQGAARHRDGRVSALISSASTSASPTTRAPTLSRTPTVTPEPTTIHQTHCLSTALVQPLCHPKQSCSVKYLYVRPTQSRPVDYSSDLPPPPSSPLLPHDSSQPNPQRQPRNNNYPHLRPPHQQPLRHRPRLRPYNHANSHTSSSAQLLGTSPSTTTQGPADPRNRPLSRRLSETFMP